MVVVIVRYFLYGILSYVSKERTSCKRGISPVRPIRTGGVVGRVRSVGQMYRQSRASLWHTSISVKTPVRRCTCSLSHKTVKFTSSTSACSSTCCCCCYYYYYYNSKGGFVEYVSFFRVFLYSWWMTNVLHKFSSVCLFLFTTLYMFRAYSAHHQERQIVSIHPLVTVILCWWPRWPPT